MKKYTYPTTIYYGEDSLDEFAYYISESNLHHLLIVTDKTLCDLGITEIVIKALEPCKAKFTIYDGTHPNPIGDDVYAGVEVYKKNKCDGIIALGGGSPMDVSKAIKILVSHEGPLEKYDDAKGGSKLVVNPMPPLFAIPTTSGTGSEVGRCSVIILGEQKIKTILFAPELLPNIAILEPKLTTKLPATLSAATGVDALTHLMEAYFAPGFDPLADGIALEGMQLVISSLPMVYANGLDITQRGKMQMAATMGATAFQKGLGMVHSLAHPLSALYNTHHGLANALLLPHCLNFLEQKPLSHEQIERMDRVNSLFIRGGYTDGVLSDKVKKFIVDLGINFGLKNHGVKESDLKYLASQAFKDVCHQTNMVPVSEEDLFEVYSKSM